MSRDDKMFYSGILAALAIVNNSNTVLFDEIVNACGATMLLAVAREVGQMRVSGMSEWVKRHPADKRILGVTHGN